MSGLPIHAEVIDHDVGISDRPPGIYLNTANNYLYLRGNEGAYHMTSLAGVMEFQQLVDGAPTAALRRMAIESEQQASANAVEIINALGEYNKTLIEPK